MVPISREMIHAIITKAMVIFLIFSACPVTTLEGIKEQKEIPVASLRL